MSHHWTFHSHSNKCSILSKLNTTALYLLNFRVKTGFYSYMTWFSFKNNFIIQDKAGLKEEIGNITLFLKSSLLFLFNTCIFQLHFVLLGNVEQERQQLVFIKKCFFLCTFIDLVLLDLKDQRSHSIKSERHHAWDKYI